MDALHRPGMRVLVEAPLVLELFINRDGFVEESELLWFEVAQFQQIELYVTELAFNKIRFFGRKLGGYSDVEIAISKFRRMLCDRIISIDDSLLKQARTYPLKDFDSAVEVTCAIREGIGAIVVQSLDRFSGINFPVLSVTTILERQRLEETFVKGNAPVLLMGNFLEITTLKELLKETRHHSVNSALPHPSLDGLDISSLKLHGADLSKINLSKANLSNANLAGANLAGANLADANLTGANLAGANLANANLTGANLANANLTGANLERAKLCGAWLNNSILVRANLDKADLTQANLSGSSLECANLTFSRLYSANLDRTVFKGSILRGADFRDASLEGADLSGAMLMLVNFSNANLRNARLLRANLNDAILDNCDLTRAKLNQSHLCGTSLKGANLCDTELSGTNLLRADLSLAKLQRAVVMRSYLSDAKLVGTDLQEAELNSVNLNRVDLATIGNIEGTRFEGDLGIDEAMRAHLHDRGAVVALLAPVAPPPEENIQIEESLNEYPYLGTDAWRQFTQNTEVKGDLEYRFDDLKEALESFKETVESFENRTPEQVKVLDLDTSVLRKDCDRIEQEIAEYQKELFENLDFMDNGDLPEWIKNEFAEELDNIHEQIQVLSRYTYLLHAVWFNPSLNTSS